MRFSKCMSGNLVAKLNRSTPMPVRRLPRHFRPSEAQQTAQFLHQRISPSAVSAGAARMVPFPGHSTPQHNFQRPSPATDKVMSVQQQIHCEIGCNDDERGRGQELIISVTLWDSLRSNLLKHQPDFEDLATQKERAESPEWKAHAELQLRGTHNNEILSKTVTRIAEEGGWFTIEAMADCIAREVLAQCQAPKITVLIDKPEALRKRGVRTAACEITRSWQDIFAPEQQHSEPPLTDKVMTLEQQIHCEIGCTEEERGRPQEVLISITVWDRLRQNLLQHQPDFDDLAAQKRKAGLPEWRTHAELQLRGTHNNASLAKIAQRVAEDGKWFTIEALADAVAREVLADTRAPQATVRVDKPQALRKWRVAAAACEVTRTQQDLSLQ